MPPSGEAQRDQSAVLLGNECAAGAAIQPLAGTMTNTESVFCAEVNFAHCRLNNIQPKHLLRSRRSNRAQTLYLRRVKQRFEAMLDHLEQKSDTAKACIMHCVIGRLALYLDDRRIEMGTNAVERATRPIKLNAKNSVFAGCDEGAES